MSSLTTYNSVLGEPVQIVRPDPVASGGLALNDNFKALTDGVLSVLSRSSGAASLATSYSTTTSWASTGLSVTLPSAGTYLVIMVVRCFNNAANAYMSLRLFNSTDSAVISNSTLLGPLSSATGTFQSTSSASILVTTTGANKTIQLQAIQNAGTAGQVVHTDSGGGTYLTYVQIE